MISDGQWPVKSKALRTARRAFLFYSRSLAVGRSPFAISLMCRTKGVWLTTKDQRPTTVLMKIVSAAEMRAIDRATSERFGVPSLTLMENAGAAVADYVLSHYASAARIVVFCGKGNNGGDGFVAARRLHEKGKNVQVILLADPAELRGDAADRTRRRPRSRSARSRRSRPCGRTPASSSATPCCPARSRVRRPCRGVGEFAVTAESLGWLAPAPVWGDAGVGVESPALLQPFLVELTSDQFMAEFLAVLGAQGGASPASLATMAPHRTSDGTASGPYRLYQPLSQCYYLVTASLVCRRVGIPDRAVRPSKGERTTFVVRHLADDGSEQAWIPATGPPATPSASPTGSWIPAAPPTGSWITAAPGQLAVGEETAHRTPRRSRASPPRAPRPQLSACPNRAGRTVHYGYIATSRRERMVTALPDQAAVDKLLSIDPSQKEEVILGDLVSRVIQPWGVLLSVLPPTPYPVDGAVADLSFISLTLV